MWPDRLNERGQVHPRRLTGHTEDILSVALCPPNLLCTGSYDGTLISHNIESGAINRRVQLSRVDASDSSTLDASDTSVTTSVKVGRSVAIETLAVLDAQRRVLPDCVLVCGSADGKLRLFSAGDMRLLDEVRACRSLTEGLQHVATEESSTFIASGDTSGYIQLWDVSELPKLWPSNRELLNAPEDVPVLRRTALRRLYSWRAHARAITHVEYLTSVEGIISASFDCTVRLWTLSGEQVGVFGQPMPWSLQDRASWFDSTCAPLEGTTNDKVLASEQKIQTLLPQQAATNATVSAFSATSLSKTAVSASDTATPSPRKNIYRLQQPQLAQIDRLGSLLSHKPVRQSGGINRMLLVPPLPPVSGLRRSASVGIAEAPTTTRPAASRPGQRGMHWMVVPSGSQPNLTTQRPKYGMAGGLAPPV